MCKGNRKFAPEQWALSDQTGCVLMCFILPRLPNFSLPAFFSSPPPPPLFLLVALLVHLVLLGFPPSAITWPTLICSSWFQLPCPFLVYKAACPHVTFLFWVCCFKTAQAWCTRSKLFEVDLCPFFFISVMWSIPTNLMSSFTPLLNLLFVFHSQLQHPSVDRATSSTSPDVQTISVWPLSLYLQNI